MKDIVAQAGNFVRSFIHRFGSEKTPTPPISEQSFDLIVDEKKQSMVAEAVAIVGQLNCQGDLSIEGQFKGSIQAADYTVVIGSNGLADGDITASNLWVKGRVIGEISVADKIIIAKTGTIIGNLQAAKVELENGAKYKGIIEINPVEHAVATSESASENSTEKSPPTASVPGNSAMEPS
jgi:cytoskeletal protein CcmA (bactofilin family)